ncbi:MAG: phosphoethanolamine--lipid A transferase [Alphaproteobacteria bacterium]|nr:phosphoethanolamine--lipid A transferase [Alphaproteobacteria bacterium]
MLKTKTPLNSTLFIAIISAYFSFMLNVKFWQFAVEKIEIDGFSVALFALTLPFFIFIPLFWFFSLIFVPRIGKPLVMLLLVLSAASDYALQNLGIVINSDMIRNFAETNLREASDFITLRAVAYVLIVGVLPAVWVYRTPVRFSSLKKEVKTRLLLFLAGLLTIGLIASAVYKEYASFGRNNSQVRYYINTFNYIYAVGRYYKRSADTKRKFVILDRTPQRLPNSQNKPRVLVLLVGETARAANFSLYGYEQNTNPELSRNKDITVFQNVSSCGTATAVSLPCMFSHLTRKRFNLTDAQYTQNLLDIAQSAGYDVFWKDNDDGCKKVCTRINHVDAKDGNKAPYCFGDYCHDDILLDGLENGLKDIKKDTLIVLHMMGSHGPTYFKRYPDKFKRFLPACDTANLQNCSQEQIVNTYNNTILYTDYVISSVINILNRQPQLQSGMLYASDHGESLGENNLYLHGLPYAIAPDEQKKIPMIMWLSPDLQKALRLNRSCLNEKAATQSFSHDNYFHTVLRMLFIDTTAYDRQLDIFSRCDGSQTSAT